ncbi:MAG: signal recognition particle-docking protein FtsY [Methylohalobius sp.]|nr:signal recognition particle-docking protein FtsY [Methylohalobius sp.]
MDKKLVLASLLLILATSALGSYVRLSMAGLVCPDLPFCYGHLWPPDSLSEQDLKAYPGFAYDPFRAWLQMGHRFAAGLLGIALAGSVGLALWRRQRPAWANLILLGLYAGTAMLGGGLVVSRLWPPLVVAHLLMAVLMAVVAWRWYLTLKPSEDIAPGRLKLLAGLAWWVVLAQILLGGWVGAQFAGSACSDFPTCGGSWWPPVDWEAFAFWKQGDPSAWALLDANARITLHWFHRLGAALVFLILFVLATAVSSNPRLPHISKLGLLLNFLLFVEIALGMGVVRYGFPALAVAHSLGAVVLLLTVGTIEFYLRHRPSLPPEEETVTAALPVPETWYGRLQAQLAKTRRGLTGFLVSLPWAGRELNEDLKEEIETHLLLADVGVAATQEIVASLSSKLAHRQLQDKDEVLRALHDTLFDLLAPCSQPLRIDPTHKPFVILVVGVNGVGKTTTIGKLAQRFRRQGHSVMLAAGDTFRAAAIEQLKTWGERSGIPVIAQHLGADSASVIYDALQSAKARGIDVLIADTAGRLHTKSNLMEELAKIKRIMAKLDPTAPHEVLLVLDATTGQNALIQAEQFNQAVGVSGLVLTKLDGTAKGGIIFALAKRFGIPVRFIGIGEGIYDLQDFDAKAFVDALFAEPEAAPAQFVH